MSMEGWPTGHLWVARKSPAAFWWSWVIHGWAAHGFIVVAHSSPSLVGHLWVSHGTYLTTFLRCWFMSHPWVAHGTPVESLTHGYSMR